MELVNMRLWIYALLTLLLCNAQPALAGEAVVNSEVTISFQSNDPATARQTAMAKAETQALLLLLERLSNSSQAKDLMADLDAKKINSMVKGTQIVDEKITSDQYRAKLLVSYDGDAISELMSGKANPNDTREVIPASVNAFLVIPALEMGAQKLLWEESNIFRTTWNDVALEVTSGDVIVPYGDGKDAAILAYDNMMTANFQALSGFASRYGVSDIILLQAKYTTRPDMMLNVIRRNVGRQETNVTVNTYRADPQETRDQLFARAARDIIAELHSKKVDAAANMRAVRGGDRKKIMMLASITTMASWTDLRKKLVALPMVDRVETLAVSARQVDMVVSYRGSEESFTKALASQSIRLLKNPNYWVVAND